MARKEIKKIGQLIRRRWTNCIKRCFNDSDGKNWKPSENCILLKPLLKIKHKQLKALLTPWSSWGTKSLGRDSPSELPAESCWNTGERKQGAPWQMEYPGSLPKKMEPLSGRDLRTGRRRRQEMFLTSSPVRSTSSAKFLLTSLKSCTSLWTLFTGVTPAAASLCSTYLVPGADWPSVCSGESHPPRSHCQFF